MENIRTDDREFLLNTSQWPEMEGFGRYCCLKATIEGSEYEAFILTADNPNGMEGRVVVAAGNVFSGGTGATHTYESVDEILKTWTVD